MKKWYLTLLIILLCAASVFLARARSDNSAPRIKVESTPTLACEITFDELMSHATAEDKHLKDFFIEETSLSDIADKGYLTYVAIDDSNNVAKMRTNVDVDEAVTNYHIETIKPLQTQVKEAYKTTDYLVLKNDCGWEIEDSFIVEAVVDQYSLQGAYEVQVTAKNHSDVQPLYTIREVDDFKSPKIILLRESLRDYTIQEFNDDYFLNLIDHIEDDNDDPEELKEKVFINWKEILKPDEEGHVDKAGTYTITYSVIDSENHTGISILTLMVVRP